MGNNLIIITAAIFKTYAWGQFYFLNNVPFNILIYSLIRKNYFIIIL